MTTPPYRLLGPDDPPAVAVEREDGGSPFFLTCEHAGRELPQRLGALGLSDEDLGRHIAWDIGAAQVARGLSARLEAPLVLQSYSRLVIDCNRSLDSHDSITPMSEDTQIPGNHDLQPGEAAARAEEVFHPYHDAIVRGLDRRRTRGEVSILVAVHSFTPVFRGESRPWHVGLLFNRDDRLGRVLEDRMGRDRALRVGVNEPYAISDETDYTIPVHGEGRGILHVEFEIRQDLIAEEDGQREWAERLEVWLRHSLERLAPDGDPG